MPSGGYRPGAGAKKGAKYRTEKKRRLEEVVSHFVSSGETTPLEVMLAVMKQAWDLKNVPLAMSAAQAAAPYIHPKLASTELKGDPNAPLIVRNVEVTFIDDKPASTPKVAAPTARQIDAPKSVQRIIPSRKV